MIPRYHNLIIAIGCFLIAVTASTSKIQLTIGGATAGAGMVADVTVMWRSVVGGGYYLNA